MKRILAIIGICFWVHTQALAETAVMAPPAVAKPKEAKKPVLVREIKNFHVVAPGILRGAQPKDEAFAVLKTEGRVKTVIDLRQEKDQIAAEKSLVEGLGMTFVSIPMSGGREQSPETVNKVLSIMTDPARQPVFVHCQAGKDRTGLILAAYRMKYNGWSQEDAVQEMLAYGYDRGCCSAMEASLTQWSARP